MLERDTNGTFYVERSWGGTVGYRFQSLNFTLGYTLSETDYQRWLRRQENTPVEVMRCEGVTWWMFNGKFYLEDEGYTADEVKLKILELERVEKLEISELERSGERLDEKKDIDFLNSLPMDDVKVIASIRNQAVQNLHNDAKKEYDDWVFKGKSSVQQAAREFLKPGEDIKQLEKFIGKIPVDFLGGGTFESSPMYGKWVTKVEEAKRKLENAKKVLRTKLGFPDIGVEQEEALLTDNRRETIPDNVKMQVWKRDGGKCVRCGSQEKLEYDHIIPLCKGGSNTARNIQLLCEKCNRSKGRFYSLRSFQLSLTPQLKHPFPIFGRR